MVAMRNREDQRSGICAGGVGRGLRLRQSAGIGIEPEAGDRVAQVIGRVDDSGPAPDRR